MFTRNSKIVKDISTIKRKLAACRKLGVKGAEERRKAFLISQIAKTKQDKAT